MKAEQSVWPAMVSISLLGIVYPAIQSQAATRPSIHDESRYAVSKEEACGSPGQQRDKVLLPLEFGFHELMRDVFLEHEDFLKRTQVPGGNAKVIPEGERLRYLIGVSESDYLIIQTYSSQAYQRTEAALDEMVKHRGEDLTEYEVKYKVLMEQFVSNLKQELPPETYERVDAFVLREYRTATRPHLPRRSRN